MKNENIHIIEFVTNSLHMESSKGAGDASLNHDLIIVNLCIQVVNIWKINRFVRQIR